MEQASDLGEGLSAQWKSFDSLPNVRPFSDLSGLNIDFLEVKDPISFYKLFITDDFVCLLAQQTSSYAKKRIGRSQPLSCRS